MNPFDSTWTTAFGLPPFDAIKPEHFRPAFDRVLGEHREKLKAIAENAEAPSFKNTIEAFELSFEPLGRVSAVFYVLTGAHTSDALEEVDLEISPLLARHYSELYLDSTLYARVDALNSARDQLGLSAEQLRVLERYHLAFIREGAALDAGARARLVAISERLALMGTQFGQNVLADEKGYTLELDPKRDLAGLPDFAVSSAAAAGDEHKQPGKYLVTLSRSSIEPFLTFSDRRDLRETAWRAWAHRGDNNGETDNKALIAETVALREERAKLLGYKDHAEYRLSDAMAKTPKAARDMLEAVWPAARATAMRDRDGLREIAQSEGLNIEIEPWDWRYYAEKLRKARYAIDTAEVKPYLQLEKIIEAAFYTATKLFGLSFKLLDDAKLYHPDARAWEVTDKAGRHVGVFIGDYFARPSKRSGAWMTSLRDQYRLDRSTPIIINVMNFSKADDGAPSLLSYDDARTLFHEFGHGLHGLLSDVEYPLLSGTAVATDFVELPSQLYEHWLETTEILGRFAVHAETGKPMPKELLDRVLAARNFDQGFATVEYLSSAIVDLDFHSKPAKNIDVAAFERETLAEIDMPKEMIMRHRPPHFQHIFSGSGYAAAYYSYMWSEMLDADAFAAFKEKGDIFDPETAKKLHDFIYSAGNKRDPAEAYLMFRGSMPKVDGVLKKRGLSVAA
ncbi:peptidyl-dipeptidase dcp [Variibacter gotjawalensis]|uniref:Peptidyl-dipeptidase dcp n=1 Tax=Variibacter gotjawalensis TaxID=1333996 RepID=A0A0S3PVI4_9BRAD|nr:M3 family metallopeptidase [Variibacter gotjawalensis]NIK45764.1 peptidyl-dipeptidase Dcp [Variibacter gotjawalensis]RZS47688.1 peptidyl-dipeptidase Dcp [Variibacter gotjawalensis]BAT59941.1 peptidyl-dipeptidase dcp [Variibacter gotjawalensis]